MEDKRLFSFYHRGIPIFTSGKAAMLKLYCDWAQDGIDEIEVRCQECENLNKRCELCAQEMGGEYHEGLQCTEES